MVVISEKNDGREKEEVGASGLACTLACGSICILTSEVGGIFYASVATVL